MRAMAAVLAGILVFGAAGTAAAQPERTLEAPWELQMSASPKPGGLGDEWRPVQVPSHLRRQGGPYAWYRHRFAVPADWRGAHAFLKFGGVKFVSEVYVNGRRVGGHYGGWEPFEVEITGACRFGGVNELLVRVQDVRGLIEGEVPDARGRDLIRSVEGRVMAPVGSQTSLFGIWQDVRLLRRREVFIDDVSVVTSVRNKRIEARCVLRNLGAEPRTATLAGRVMDGDALALDLGGATLSVPAHGQAEAVLASAWADPKLWMPDSPHLYRLESRLEVGGEPFDRQSTRFGFREFWTDGIYFVLNGVRMKFLATAGHPPGDGGLMSDEEIRERYRAIRQANCVAMRLHANVWPERWYEIADEVGLPIIEESAIWCFARNYALERDEFWQNARAHWRGIVRRDKNHPSVVMYSIENEILHVGGDRVPETEKRLGDLGRFVKALDPTRPIMYDGDEDPDGAADVINLHYPHEFPANTQYPNTCYWLERPTVVSGWPRRLWQWDRRKPLYVGEFLWVPARTAHGLTLFLGDEAYRSRADSLMKAKAIAWEMQVQAYRAAEVSGMCPWTLWELGPRSKDIREAVRRAYEPNAAFVKEYDRRFFAGDEVARTLFLYNDTLRPAELTLSWSLGGAEQGRRTFALQPAERVETSIALDMPEVAAVTTVPFELSVESGGRTAYRAARDYRVFPRRAPRFTAPAGTRVALYGEDAATAEFLRAGGLQPVPLANLSDVGRANTQVLVVAPHALDGLAGGQAVPVVGGTANESVTQFVRSGGAMLVLEQDALPPDFLPAELNDVPATIGFRRARAGALLGDLAEDAFSFWRGDNVVARKPLMKPRDGAFRVFADTGRATGLDRALAMEVCEGEGRYIFSQLLIGEKLGTEPMAGLMLERLLNRALTARPARRPLGLVRGREPLREDLEAAGVELEDLTGRLASSDLSAYDVLLLSGSARELVAQRKRLRRFVQAGGTALVHEVTPEAIEELGDVLPSDLAVLPSGTVPVLLLDRDDPVTDGMTNEDLHWIFDWSGDPRRPKPLSPEVLRSQLMRPPPPPEDCTAIEAVQMRMLRQRAGTVNAAEGYVYFFANGALETEVDLPRGGAYFFGLAGRGTPVQGAYPNLTFHLDGRLVGNVTVGEPAGRFFTQVDAPAGRHVLRISYTNDVYAPEKGEDRNVRLDRFFFAERPEGPEQALLRPPGLVRLRDGRGAWLFDQVGWDGRVASYDPAARYLSNLLTNLGVAFRPRPVGAYIPASQLEPVGEFPNFGRDTSGVRLGSNGTVAVQVRFIRAGRYRIAVSARGTPAEGEYPAIRLHLDGRPVGEAQLTRGGWQDLTFEARLEAGTHDVAIEFFNDRWVPEMNEDRNLLIRHLTIGR